MLPMGIPADNAALIGSPPNTKEVAALAAIVAAVGPRVPAIAVAVALDTPALTAI